MAKKKEAKKQPKKPAQSAPEAQQVEAQVVQAPLRAQGSRDGLKEERVAEGSTFTLLRSKRDRPMTDEQIIACARHQEATMRGKRQYVPPPPPPREVDAATARFIALREEQKKEQQRARFEELREKHKNDPKKTGIKRRVNQLVGGKRAVRAKKEVDPNAPRAANPYKAGSMKALCFDHFLKHATVAPEKLARGLVEKGASESTAKSWLRVFARYAAGGEK